MSLKPFYLRLTCIVAMCCALVIAFTHSSEAKINPSSGKVVSQPKELILQITGLTVKNYTNIRKAIEDNPGVTFRDYCFSNNTIMYVIDRDIQPDNQFIMDALAPYNLTYVVKEGSIAGVQAICTDTQTEDPTE